MLFSAQTALKMRLVTLFFLLCISITAAGQDQYNAKVIPVSGRHAIRPRSGNY
jgi:hypothetical protein